MEFYSALKFLAATSSNSFSERAITAVARQLPITLTDVRAISIRTSIPRIIKIGSTGKPKLATVPSSITSEALDTPATPLLVSIRVKQIIICFSMGRSIPAAYATKIDASERYNVVPSRLKLYPVGITNATIFLGIPNFSIVSIADGKADSEFDVAKAIVAGSDTALINGLIGILNISATGSRTKTRN